jgi:hypothetical protein
MQEPRQPSLQKSECLGSMVRGAPASARVRRLPREGTRTPSTWRRWMGDVAPSFHRLLFCEVAPPQERLDSVRVVYSPPPLVRHPSPRCHSSPRRARSCRTQFGCGKESILRSFAVGCFWSSVSGGVPDVCRITILLLIFDISKLFCCILSFNNV